MRAVMTGMTAALALVVAVPALAAPHITSAAVTGPSGTVWDTTANSYYTLFVQKPVGTVLNPGDEAVDSLLGAAGDSNYLTAGDGWPTDTKTGNSDPFYTLTLTLEDGGTVKLLSGTYTPGAGLFVAAGGAARFGSTDYALTAFAWNRTLSNVVGKYSVGSATYQGQPLGSKSDYPGAFTVTAAAAVPEPATWGLLILGFGTVGAVVRRAVRRSNARFEDRLRRLAAGEIA